MMLAFSRYLHLHFSSVEGYKKKKPNFQKPPRSHVNGVMTSSKMQARHAYLVRLIFMWTYTHSIKLKQNLANVL